MNSSIHLYPSTAWYRLRRARARTAMLATSLLARVRLRVLHGATLGAGLSVAGPLRIVKAPGGSLRIGAAVRLRAGIDYNPVANHLPNAWWIGPAGQLTIHDRAGLSATTIVCQRQVTIGPDTFIGGGTRIFDTDFHPLSPAERAAHRPATTAPVTIGAACFLGADCLILKGVTIGDGAVVGAGSVVTRDVPPGERWAGNPARCIRPQ